MAYTTIQNSEIQNGAPLDQNLLLKIKDNFDAQQDVINRTVGIGTVRMSTLILAQFEAEHPGQWMLMNGQSCAGTTYATLTGNIIVPDMITDGTFPRQAKAGRGLGSFEADDNKEHKHLMFKNGDAVAVNSNVTRLSATETPYSNDSTGVNYGSYNIDGVVAEADIGLSGKSGSTETRPKNIAMNFFIKVGY